MNEKLFEVILNLEYIAGKLDGLVYAGNNSEGICDTLEAVEAQIDKLKEMMK